MSYKIVCAKILVLRRRAIQGNRTIGNRCCEAGNKPRKVLDVIFVVSILRQSRNKTTPLLDIINGLRSTVVE